MNELHFARRIRQVLDQGTVNTEVAAKLAQARQLALSRQRPEGAAMLRWADNVLGAGRGWGGLWARVLLPVLLLAIASVGIYRWQESQRLDQIIEIDEQLLTDELPIDAYLDRGFQNWLKKRAAEE